MQNDTQPTDNMQTNTPGQNARLLLKNLQANFTVFRNHAPLTIGIDKQLLARLPETDRKVLRIALGMHTNSLRYLKAMERATHRVDLDGNIGDALTEDHRKHAAEILRDRFNKEAERRKAQREAEARERQRTEKLQLLVEKFGKNR